MLAHLPPCRQARTYCGDVSHRPSLRSQLSHAAVTLADGGPNFTR
jgi:hypothetical protein